MAAHINLNGTAGTHISSEIGSVTEAGFDIVVVVSVEDWRPDNTQVLASQWTSDGDNRIWQLALTDEGYLQFIYSSDGITIEDTITSTEPIPEEAPLPLYIRLNCITFASISVEFYHSSDGEEWIELGDPYHSEEESIDLYALAEISTFRIGQGSLNNFVGSIYESIIDKYFVIFDETEEPEEPDPEPPLEPVEQTFQLVKERIGHLNVAHDGWIDEDKATQARSDILGVVWTLRGDAIVSDIVVSPETPDPNELQNYQYRYRGLIWGAYTPFGVEEEEGIESVEVRTSPRPIPRQHGDIPSNHYAEGKLIRMKVVIDGHGNMMFDDVERLLSDWKHVHKVRKSISLDDDYLEVQYPGRPRRKILARPISIPVERRAVPGPHTIEFTQVWECPNPRLLCMSPHQIAIPPYSASVAGIDFPVDFPVDFPQMSTFERVAHNSGNDDSYPILKVHGPTVGAMTKVVLMNMTNESVLQINTPVVVDQILTADMEAFIVPTGKSVITLDTSSRYSDWVLPREPFYLSPGDNVLRLMIDGSVTGLTALLDWQCTWI